MKKWLNNQPQLGLLSFIIILLISVIWQFIYQSNQVLEEYDTFLAKAKLEITRQKAFASVADAFKTSSKPVKHQFSELKSDPKSSISKQSYQLDTISIDTISKPREARAKSKPKLININTADSTQLLMVYGIGPVFASRIIKYRKLLGGFIKLDQLKEIYGMRIENYNKIVPQLYVSNNPKIKKINIYTTDFKRVLKHPYTSYKLTRVLMPFFEQIRRDSTILTKESFKMKLFALQVVEKEPLNKLIPYLQYDRNRVLESKESKVVLK